MMRWMLMFAAAVWIGKKIREENSDPASAPLLSPPPARRKRVTR